MGKDSLMFFARFLIVIALSGIGAAQAKPLHGDLVGAVAGDQGRS